MQGLSRSTVLLLMAGGLLLAGNSPLGARAVDASHSRDAGHSTLPRREGSKNETYPGVTVLYDSIPDAQGHRLRMIAQGGTIGMARQDTQEYIDEDSVKAELLWARRLCNRRGWPVIDVTRRSIEETAATVLQLMEAWHERRRRAQRAPS